MAGGTMKKAYFQYYETFEAIVRKFKTAEERESIRTKIISYGLFGEIPENLSDKEELVWDVISDLIDSQRHRREINSENRRTKKTSGNEEKETEENETAEKESKSSSAELNRNEKNRTEMKRTEVNSAESGAHTSPRFKKPTPDEIQSYCRERNNSVDALRFFDFYESKGWKVGRTPMKDWRAAVRTWEQESETPRRPPHFEQKLPDGRLTF